SRSGGSRARSPGRCTSASTGQSATGFAPAMASSAPELLSPRAREIVAAGRALLEKEGPEALSMRRVADRLGVKAPSLYKHLPDKAALEDALVSAGFEELAAAFEGAGDLESLGAAYRTFARAHPHLYRLMTERPLRRDRLTPGVEERAAQPLVEAAGGDEDL